MNSNAQNKELPKDYLSKEFHKGRREQLRKIMPAKSVSVFFTNPVRNRANDVDFHFHQDPNFYYLTGYREPNSVLIIFKNDQKIQGELINEIIFVQEKDAFAEMWNGKRLGIEGVNKELGFNYVYNGFEFIDAKIDFSNFDHILVSPFENDVRDTDNEADLYDLIATFKQQISINLTQSKKQNFDKNQAKFRKTIDTKTFQSLMASLREIKTKEELLLIKKAVEISAIGQIEIMKAMHPAMSELEIQGVHEFVYKKYGAEYEGYPSIVGAGNNGCILHYVDNIKPVVGDGSLVLMDLGAEYHGYTADVTRTIPANGKFTVEQKLIYDLVFKAQEAGIVSMKIGNNFNHPNQITRTIINNGLVELGIINSQDEDHLYYPHGSSHHIGLDVHDASNFGPFEENMVITVEPGIYITEGSNCDKKWWGIAVRIEDDIWITKNGPINLSAMAPRTSEDIEKTMLLPSALDAFILPKLDEGF
ncbi:aminopeptidase P N-terminal domain-containing protein [Lutibacter sp.]|uniref:aminopeptidase P N-terminal domain-containing protein n=1 Tax=Lutibacter sp. TaxID=1925666 RepID=UPI002733D44B|nr:aminopeptidase P N-terminal domain-containing protein [Lutibacter sp.]MDP3313234.1 aminopeptidase P N-terminal domain-containing protein [Lutibacter sp.]